MKDNWADALVRGCQRETKIRELNNSSYVRTHSLTSDHKPQFFLNVIINSFFLLTGHIVESKIKKSCSAFTV